MRRTLTALLLLIAAPAVAMAQNEQTAEATATMAEDPLAKENWPLSGVDRPLGLSGGMLQVDVNGSVGLPKVGDKRVSMPLAVLFGVTDELQLGLVHGTGLCLTSDCAKVYDDLGLQLLFSLFGRGSSLEIGTTFQLNFARLSDPLLLNLQVGGAMNWVVGGNVAILAYPNFGLGLNQRDAPNKESFGLPVYAYFRASEHVSPVIYTGLAQTALDGFGDYYAIPVGIGALVAVNTMIDVGARFDFLNLLGQRPANVGAADAKSLLLWLSLRPL